MDPEILPLSSSTALPASSFTNHRFGSDSVAMINTITKSNLENILQHTLPGNGPSLRDVRAETEAETTEE